MQKSALVTVALAAWALSGCMLIDSISPQVRLGDQVHQLNDEVRWGRVDLAAQRVAPAHRRQFVRSHRGWGANIHVADADVTNMDLGLPDGRAASFVTYSWFDERTMELQSTTVRQLWRGEGEGYVLVGEEVIGGDESLLPGAPVVSGEESDAIGEDGTITAGDEMEPIAGLDDVDGLEDAPTVTTTASRSRHRDSQGALID
ncbi:MAG: hypothetical protein M3Y87_14840 [Myxococcota bacterium]|nr:hypothetical protein [Myxococcota bacterium]